MTRTFSRRTVASYSRRIAKETGLPLKSVHHILMGMSRSLCLKIIRGEDIWIKGFGRIYTEKNVHQKTDING